MRYRFIEDDVSDAQVNWGGHSDPRGLLVVGATYDVLRVEQHTLHTKVFLKDFPGKSFNSVWFEEAS